MVPQMLQRRNGPIAYLSCAACAAIVVSAYAQAPLLLHRGSWTQVVKSSVDSHDSVPDTLKALKETGQNVIIYSIDSDDEFNDFRMLLYRSFGKDIQVFAAVQSWTTTCSDTRWLDPSELPAAGDCDCESYSDFADRETCKNAWLSAWKRAAAKMSQYSSLYPNLVGFVIDDFVMVESAEEPACLFGNRLTKAEVQEIRDAVRSHNPAFQFWPTYYYTGFGRALGEGYELGANYGVKLRSEEDMSVRLEFPLPDWPSSATLEFFHSDTALACETAGLYYVTKSVTVNGSAEPVWSESMVGDKQYQRFQKNIAAELHPLTNTIELRVGMSDSKQTYGCGNLFWRIWDVRLSVRFPPASKLPPVTITKFDEHFFANPLEDEYTYNPGCKGMGFPDCEIDCTISNMDERCPGLPDDELKGRLLHRLVAAPNRDYLIRDLIDGIVAPTFSTATGVPCEECIPPGATAGFTICPFSYDNATYRALLQATRRQLGDSKKLFAFHLGMGFGDTLLDADVLVQQLKIAADKADYVGVWNYPLGVHYLDEQKGVFAEHASGSPNYSLMAYWPQRQRTLSGWYQRWTSDSSLEGKTVEIYVLDLEGTTAGLFEKKVSCAGLVDWSEDESDPLGTDTIGPFTVGKDPIVLEVELVGAIGNQVHNFYFEAVEVTTSGKKSLGTSVWHYETGVTELHYEVIKPYNLIRDTFLDFP